MRAFLLVILLNILISWMMPKDRQPETFKNSRYFQLAGEFAKPIENLIPKETLDTIRNKAAEVSGKTVEEEDKKAEEKEAPKKSNDADELFEKLAQPQVKSKKAKETAKQPEKIQEKL